MLGTTANKATTNALHLVIKPSRHIQFYNTGGEYNIRNHMASEIRNDQQMNTETWTDR